jgi:hypothetical protein
MSRGGSKPGERRGGRSKGTPNKRTIAVAEKLEELGYDPIEGMARITVDEKLKMSIRAQMHKELAQYVASKRKAIEVRGEAGQSFIDALREANSRRDISGPDVSAIVQDKIFTSMGDW